MNTPTLHISKPTAIMGFGNPVRSDDAIGIYVIEALQNKLGEVENLKILDMGTSAFEVLFQLQGQERIILVDGVINTDEPIGTLFKVPASEIESAPQDDPMVFLHSIKWDQALSYAKKILGEAYPTDIQVYLIAIKNTKLEIDLSKEAKLAGDRVVDLIIEDLNSPLNSFKGKDPQPPKGEFDIFQGEGMLNPPKEDLEGYRSGVGGLELKSCHLIISHELAKETLGDVSHVFLRYYPERKSLLLAPIDQVWFKKMHEAGQFMLKNKNLQGDKTVAIHEILIDHELDEEDKELTFEIQGKGKILNIHL